MAADVVRFGDGLELDRIAYELRLSGRALKLERIPMEILLLLIERRGQLIAREDIIGRIWGKDVFLDTDNSINSAIRKIRRVLKDDPENPVFIQTVTGKGYRFIAPATDEVAGKQLSAPASKFLDSIAVLPFRSAGSEPDLEYLIEGVTIGLINSLSQLKGLRVVPHTTAFRYKGNVSDAAQAGRELYVRVVLTGQVFQRGDALIINVELIDTANDFQIWGANVKGGIEDIFPVQAEIAAQITNQLKLRLNDEQRKELAKRPTESREGYYLYLKAMHWANKWTGEGVRKGFDYTRQALDADPTYAQAWTALARLYTLLGFVSEAPPIETFAKAKAAALKALDIDDSEIGAHAALAFVRLVYDLDWQGSLEESLRAIELGPNVAHGHFVYSHWFLTQELYEEAEREAMIALEIDPLSMSFSYHLGLIYYFSRQYDQAIDQLHKASELDPLFGPVHQFLAFSYARKCVWKDAREEIGKALDLAKNDFRSEVSYGVISAMAGELVETRRILDKLRQEVKPPVFPFAYQCAALHVLLGETDEAFAYLDKARQGHAVELAYLAISPELDSLHEDRRFRDLLLSIGIPSSKN